LVVQADLIKVLDFLEAREYELIGWGDTGGFFSTDELEQVIEKLLPAHDPEEVEDELRDRAMIVPVIDSREIEVGVRSRMAESMHLFRSLRQWFVGQDLQRTSTLVSDYRFVRNARRYPDRNIQLSSLLKGWQDEFLKHSSTVSALESQVGDFELAGFQCRATREILAAWEERRQGNVSPSATIVCAGTGSGKTMAFYLPALSSLATDLFVVQCIEKLQHKLR